MSQAATPATGNVPKPKQNPAKGYAAPSPTGALGPHKFTRREPQPHDVQIEILFCGVCHSDLHQTRDEWKSVMPTVYPCVPGHEIAGRVTKVGSEVSKFKVGDLAAVGCMVDSDRTCENCKDGEEQFCTSMATFTYNAEDKISGGVTYGGYSDSIVVDEHFVLHVPKNLDLAAVAPLLCAGITTYSPLQPLESRARPEGRHRWPGRARTHGREIRSRSRRAHRAVHDVPLESCRWKAARRGRSGDLEKRG